MRFRPTRRLDPALRRCMRVPTFVTREESEELGEIVRKAKEDGTWGTGAFRDFTEVQRYRLELERSLTRRSASPASAGSRDKPR